MAHIWVLLHALREADVWVEMQNYVNPELVVYEDDQQVAALPWAEARAANRIPRARLHLAGGDMYSTIARLASSRETGPGWFSTTWPPRNTHTRPHADNSPS